MIPLIARRVIYPVHERLLGRRTFQYLRALEESQWASPDELRELQRIKLRDLLRHAQANTRFYRQRFRDAGVELNEADPLKTLGRLPLLNKAEIRTRSDDMLWHDSPGGLFPYDTGG